MDGVIISYCSLDESKNYFVEDKTRLNFIESVQRFLIERHEISQQSTSSNKPLSATATFVPVVNDKCLDIYELFSTVKQFGGYEIVNREQKWALVTSKLGFPANETSSLVMQSYASLLLPLEQSSRMMPNQPQRAIQSNPVPTQPQPTAAVMMNKPVVNQMQTTTATLSSNLNMVPKMNVTHHNQPSAGPFPNIANNITPGRMVPIPNVPSMQQSNNSMYGNTIPSQMGQHYMQSTTHMANQNVHSHMNTLPQNVSYANSQYQLASSNAMMNAANDKFKRARPMPTAASEQLNAFNAEAFSERLSTAIKDLNSKDISVIIKSLNFLNQKTFELTDSHAIQVESCPHLLISLGALLDVVNPITRSLFPEKGFNNILAEKEWEYLIPGKGNLEFKILAMNIEESPLLFPILNVIRNLTMETNNELLVASSVSLMRHIVSINVASVALPQSSVGDIINATYDILSNIGGKIDLSGRRKQYSNAWLDVDQSEQSIKRFLLRNVVTESALDQSILKFQRVMVTFFSSLIYSIRQSDSRSLIIKGLEIFLKLAQNADNALPFAKAPTIFYESLVELLCTSSSCVDPISQAIPAPSQNYSNSNTYSSDASSKRPPLSVGNHYFIDYSDYEIRDNALEVLLALAQLSANVQGRIASVSGILALLLEICGSIRSKYRTEGMQRVYSLLSLLSSRPECLRQLQTIHADMMAIATYDESMAGM